MRKNLLLIAGLLTVTAGLFLYVSGVLKSVGEMNYLKVKFYKMDRSTLSADKFVGTAQWKKGKYSMDILDPDLKKILQSPFSSKKGGQGPHRRWGEGGLRGSYSPNLSPGFRLKCLVW